MKEIMRYYSECNKAINEAMNNVISNNGINPFKVKLEGYFFKTLSQILEHVFVSDMIWMKTFLDVNTYELNLVNDVKEIPGYGDKIFNDYEEYVIYREKLDNFIINYIEKIQEDIFNKTISRTTKSGEKMVKVYYKSMIHFFNHQTHHRGQISNILDNLQIENNYSNMIFLDIWDVE